MSKETDDKNPFKGMVSLKAAEPATPQQTPPPSVRDHYDTQISFRTHSDVRRKLRHDAEHHGLTLEEYMHSLCTAGLAKSAPRHTGINKNESLVRITFRCPMSLRRKVRQAALDRDLTMEDYLTLLILHAPG